MARIFVSYCSFRQINLCIGIHVCIKHMRLQASFVNTQQNYTRTTTSNAEKLKLSIAPTSQNNAWCVVDRMLIEIG